MTMEKKKRNNGVISFTDKSQKEEVQRILRDRRLQNLMPDNVKGKDGLMVLWAVRFLKDLADKGKMRYQVPMFEEPSAEKQGMMDELEQLHKENKTLKEKIESLEDDPCPEDFELPEDYDPLFDLLMSRQPTERETLIKKVPL